MVGVGLRPTEASPKLSMLATLALEGRDKRPLALLEGRNLPVDGRSSGC